MDSEFRSSLLSALLPSAGSARPKVEARQYFCRTKTEPTKILRMTEKRAEQGVSREDSSKCTIFEQFEYLVTSYTIFRTGPPLIYTYQM